MSEKKKISEEEQIQLIMFSVGLALAGAGAVILVGIAGLALTVGIAAIVLAISEHIVSYYQDRLRS